MMPSSTVFIVDDDKSVRRSLSRLLRAEGFTTESFECASAYLARDRYDGNGCMLLDVNMPDMSGMQLQKQLNALGNNLPVIFLTGHGDIAMSVQAMKLGALDFLTKPVDESDLIKVVRQALEHHQSLKQDRAIEASVTSRLATMTPRESEVLAELITGAPNKIVADRLGIAVKTVKVHRAQVFLKMGVRSVAELVHICHLVGIEPKPPEST
jgi:FixJ family two-component response regulator